MLMSIIEALTLGLIQGLTEFIPVSSSGHLLLAHEIFGKSGSSLAFDVALHIGTLLALLVFFRSDLAKLVLNLAKPSAQGRLARLLILATIPAAAAGLLFNDYIDNNLRTPLVTAVMLAVVGLLMLVADNAFLRKKQKEISTAQGLSVGLAQVFALIPGVSRSGVTMTAGLFAGLSRVQAARFSFLLAIPIVAGSAFGLLVKDIDGSSTEVVPLIVGVAAAFVSGLAAIKFLLGVIAKAGLKPFAIYRLVLAVLVIVFLV